MTTHFSAKSNHGAKSQVFESFNFVVEDAEDHIRLIRKKRDQLTKALEKVILLLRQQLVPAEADGHVKDEALLQV